MRIVSGKWRGRPLRAPRTDQTRPLLDRIKTSIFDQLGARLDQPGSLPPLNVLDLFAGSGAFGLEALSRGAARCCFVERGRAALTALRANIETMGCRSDTLVRSMDVFRDPLECPWPGGFALCFVDPPYRYTQGSDRSAQVFALLERLAESPGVASDALILFRCESDVDFEGEISRTELLERRTYTHMCLWWLRVCRPAAENQTHESDAPA